MNGQQHINPRLKSMRGLIVAGSLMLLAAQAPAQDSGSLDPEALDHVRQMSEGLKSVKNIMIEAEEIQTLLNEKLPGAEITVEDLTGAQDHWQVTALWSGFQGKGLIEQHQIVNRALKAALDDGRIHALKIKTLAS